MEPLRENLLQTPFVSNSYSLFITFYSGGWKSEMLNSQAPLQLGVAM